MEKDNDLFDGSRPEARKRREAIMRQINVDAFVERLSASEPGSPEAAAIYAEVRAAGLAAAVSHALRIGAQRQLCKARLLESEALTLRKRRARIAGVVQSPELHDAHVREWEAHKGKRESTLAGPCKPLTNKVCSNPD